MEVNVRSKVVERKSLLSFFDSTKQDSLDFLGEGIQVIFWSYDTRTEEITLTEGLEKLFGYSPAELSDLDLSSSFFLQVNEKIAEKLNDSIAKKIPFDLEYKAVQKDGSAIWVKTKGQPIFDCNNEVIRYNGVTRDITAKIKKEAELAESAAQYQTLVEKSAQAVYISQDAKYQYVNKQMAELTGYSEQELIGMDYDQILDEESVELVLKRVEAFLSGEDKGSQEISVIKKDQSKRTVELRSSIIMYKDRPAMMGTLLDVTEKKMALEMVKHLAYYDTLTGLPNRNLFYKEINQFLKEAKAEGSKFALLFIDLDQFKAVNDRFGHHAGDEVIKEAGARIQELLPAASLVARYGGDEFVAVIPYENVDEVELLAKKVISEIPSALTCEIKVSATIGISLFPEHSDEVESLLRFADIAMYQSKRNENRQDNHSFYSHSISSGFLRVSKMANDLQKGIEMDQFYLVYQPKVRLGTAKIEGVEALIRWEHPDYGNVSPVDFIPLAEKSGHINQIGDWVLEKAIQDMQQVALPLVLNVNISMRQLLQESFTEKVESLLKRTGFPARYLNLEITESVALFDIDRTMEKLKRLKELGIRISLDDFGTGYSSLSYLTRLPIDCLKIDRSFVDQLENDDSKKAIIKSIIEVARNLKIEVIAEGIETKEQAELLHSYDCDKGQGYYFSKPLSFGELLNYIDS